MTSQELHNWINVWRDPRDGWAFPNRMLYQLTEALCDFELGDLTPDVLTALASPISEKPPAAGPWEALRAKGRSAAAAVVEGLQTGAIKRMTDLDADLRGMVKGIFNRDVQ